MDERFKNFVRDRLRAGVTVSHVIVEYLFEGLLIVVKFSNGASIRFVANENSWEIRSVFEMIEAVKMEVKNESSKS